MIIFELIGFAVALFVRVLAFSWLVTGFQTGKWWPLVLAALCWNAADLGRAKN